MGDTKEQSTLPSSEDVEVTTQDHEETLFTEEVKVSEKPKVARQPVELYQLQAQRQQSQSYSPPSDVSMKPLDRELINLAVRKPVQEYKQNFLQNVHKDSEKVMHLAESCDLLEYEKKIAESWRQTIEDDRVVREQMEREEAE